jgi:deoxyribonuclease-4
MTEPRFGAHMSIAGGLPRAVQRAVAHDCAAMQIFTKSSGQWRARAWPASEVVAFRDALERSGITPVVAHASYLINLAAPSGPLRARSVAALGEEVDRAETLGLRGVVVHPGCSTGAGEEEGLRFVADAVATTLSTRRRGRVLVVLEHTAGQGTSLGWRFEHLARILAHLDGHPRVAVCLDTCHLFAAGYDLGTPSGYGQTFDAFDRIVGLDRLAVVHVNDSKHPLGSRRDRHEHIGRGTLGIGAFRRLVNDRRLASLPMLLETPKSGGRRITDVDADPLDVQNLATLRRLWRHRGASGRRGTPPRTGNRPGRA